MPGRARSGFTLLELALVLGLLGLSAAVLIPAMQPARDLGLETAAAEFADAVRFARNEALRTGQPHGFDTTVVAGRLRVYRADLSTTPPTPIYDVRHPLTLRLYDLQLDDLAAGAALARNATWSGACNAPGFVTFDAEGSPHCGDPLTAVVDQGTLTFSLGGASRDVVLSGPLGRVVVR